jgi:hypothetical protein
VIARFVFFPAVLVGIIISLSACADSLGVLSTETPTAVIAGQEAVAAQIMTATVAPTTSAAETLAARPTAFPPQVPVNQPESTVVYQRHYGLRLAAVVTNLSHRLAASLWPSAALLAAPAGPSLDIMFTVSIRTY